MPFFFLSISKTFSTLFFKQTDVIRNWTLSLYAICSNYLKVYGTPKNANFHVQSLWVYIGAPHMKIAAVSITWLCWCKCSHSALAILSEMVCELGPQAQILEISEIIYTFVWKRGWLMYAMGSAPNSQQPMAAALSSLFPNTILCKIKNRDYMHLPIIIIEWRIRI